MNTRLHVDNLAATTSYSDLMELFSAHGNVVDIHLAVDRATGRPRGFGFVTMATPEGARAAMKALQGKETGTHEFTVSEARPNEERAGSPGGSCSPRRGVIRTC